MTTFTIHSEDKDHLNALKAFMVSKKIFNDYLEKKYCNSLIH
jgi:hypothetical protein